MIRNFILAVALIAGPASAQLNGVNLSGGEFSGVENGALIPKPSDVQAYYDVGFRLFRLPFNSKQFGRADAIAKWRAVADKCVALNVPCIFDRHEYSSPPPDEQIAFWKKVDVAMPDNDLIAYDTMNEPKGWDDPVLTNNWEEWARDSRIVIHGLRAAGVTKHIWLEYPQYSGIDRFNKSEKRDCISAACGLRKQGNINDPLTKTGVQAHRYFDKGGSGTSAYCDKGKATSHFTKFAREVAEWGMPAMIGEAAFGKTGGCKAVADATMTEMRAGIPNLYGVTWWGGGRGWGSKYIFSTSPNISDPYVARLVGR